MPGTVIGGKKAAATNKANNPDFYREIALKAQEAWDRNGRAPRGFEANKELARRAGAIGGRKSRRTGVKNKTVTDNEIQNLVAAFSDLDPLTQYDGTKRKRSFWQRLWGKR